MSKKTKRNLKKFRSAKFNYAKFVKNYYIDKGAAYISAKVNSIDDIISKYSIKDYEWINSDFASYLEESAYYIPMEEAIVIEICGGNFSEEQKAYFISFPGKVTLGYIWMVSAIQLEKEMTTHSSVFAWRTPGMAEPGGWPSRGSHRVGHD